MKNTLIGINFNCYISFFVTKNLGFKRHYILVHIFKEGNTIKSVIFTLNEIIFSKHVFFRLKYIKTKPYVCKNAAHYK